MAKLRTATKEKQVGVEKEVLPFEITQEVLHERAQLLEKVKKQAATMSKTTKAIAVIEKQVEAALRKGEEVEHGAIRVRMETKATRKSVSWKNEFISAVSAEAADEIIANTPTGSKMVMVIEVNPEYKPG